MTLATLDMPPIADQLREAIEKSGLSANQLAKLVGISQPTVSRFIAGADIRLSVAQKIAEKLEMRSLTVDPPDEDKPAKRKR